MQPPTVTTRELGLFLDTVSNAQLTLRSVPQISDILARLCGLANAKSGYIGEVRKDVAEKGVVCDEQPRVLPPYPAPEVGVLVPGTSYE